MQIVQAMKLVQLLLQERAELVQLHIPGQMEMQQQQHLHFMQVDIV